MKPNCRPDPGQLIKVSLAPDSARGFARTHAVVLYVEDGHPDGELRTFSGARIQWAQVADWEPAQAWELPDNGERVNSIIAAAGMSESIVASTNFTYMPPGRMKASELVAHLQAAIQAHGDHDVAMEYDGVLCSVDRPKFTTEFGEHNPDPEFALGGFTLPVFLI